MSSRSGLGVCTAALLAAAVVACNGKPEDTGQGGSAEEATAKTPAPPYPVWANAMIGKGLKDVSHGAASCKGTIDIVTTKHTGARPGSEIEGWAWNEKDARPIARVLFVDPNDRVVGGANGGFPRPDVVSALSEVKTPAVGWKGVAGSTSGSVTAVGLTEAGASCVLSSVTL